MQIYVGFAIIGVLVGVLTAKLRQPLEDAILAAGLPPLLLVLQGTGWRRALVLCLITLASSIACWKMVTLHGGARHQERE